LFFDEESTTAPSTAVTVANSAEEGNPGPSSADEGRSLGPSSGGASTGTVSAEDAAEAVDEMTQNNDEDDEGSGGDNDSD
jgi:hypothetical protein